MSGLLISVVSKLSSSTWATVYSETSIFGTYDTVLLCFSGRLLFNRLMVRDSLCCVESSELPQEDVDVFRWGFRHARRDTTDHQDLVGDQHLHQPARVENLLSCNTASHSHERSHNVSAQISIRVQPTSGCAVLDG